MSLMLMTCCVLMVAGCADQPEVDWYDHTVERNQQRDAYIEAMVDAGVTAEEARNLHDRRVWEMNTINMAREGEPPE